MKLTRRGRALREFAFILAVWTIMFGSLWVCLLIGQSRNH